MSKLTDLVARMGRQSPQPIGFGALAGTASASPTMALVGRTNAAGAADALAAADAKLIDAVLVDFANAEGERVTGTEAMRRLGVKTGVVSRLCRDGKLDGEKRGQTWMVSVESVNRYALSGVGETLAGILWGASASGLSGDEADALAAAGCDFFVIGEDGAPGAVVSHANAAKLMALSEPVDRGDGGGAPRARRGGRAEHVRRRRGRAGVRRPREDAPSERVGGRHHARRDARKPAAGEDPRHAAGRGRGRRGRAAFQPGRDSGAGADNPRDAAKTARGRERAAGGGA